MLALESSSDIANPPPHPANSPCRRRETKQKHNPAASVNKELGCCQQDLGQGCTRPPTALHSLLKVFRPIKASANWTRLVCLFWAPSGGRGGKTVRSKASCPSLAPRGSHRGWEERSLAGGGGLGGGAGASAGQGGKVSAVSRPRGCFRRLSRGRGGQVAKTRLLGPGAEFGKVGKREGAERSKRGSRNRGTEAESGCPSGGRERPARGGGVQDDEARSPPHAAPRRPSPPACRSAARLGAARPRRGS